MLIAYPLARKDNHKHNMVKNRHGAWLLSLFFYWLPWRQFQKNATSEVFFVDILTNHFL